MPTSRRCDQRDYGEHVKMAACLSADHEPIQRMFVQVIFSRPNHPWSPSAPATLTPMKVITVRQAVLDIWNDFNNPLEGVHFMYLDVKGLVTTGMGNLIDSPADAEQLAWQHTDGTPASTDEIDAEWERVKGRTDLAPDGGGAFAADAQLFLTGEEEIKQQQNG